MKKPTIRHDGSKFYADTHAGRIVSDEVGALDKIAMAIEENKPQPPHEFLAAWKDGVRLAGMNLFEVKSETLEAATHIDQLRPNEEAIAGSLGVMSQYECVFILSLLQFFSDSTARELCEEIDCPLPSLAEIANMDAKHRAIIVRLISSYNGW